jgi:hypothetical protein
MILLFATHLRGEPTTEQRESVPAAATDWAHRQRRIETEITRAPPPVPARAGAHHPGFWPGAGRTNSMRREL